MQFLNTAGII